MSPATVRRVHSELRETVCEAPPVPATSASAVAAIVRPLIGASPVEVFGMLLLNGKHRVVGWCEVSRGTLTASLVHPREVFGPALRLGAAAIVVVHNHPSGDPSPSQEDLTVTKRLADAGRLLGVPLLDHVVIGDGLRFHSIRERTPHLVSL